MVGPGPVAARPFHDPGPERRWRGQFVNYQDARADLRSAQSAQSVLRRQGNLSRVDLRHEWRDAGQLRDFYPDPQWQRTFQREPAAWKAELSCVGLL